MALALLIGPLTGPAAAQDVNCTNPTAQVEINYCAEVDFLAADVYLNEAYRDARALMRKVDADLPAAQRGAEAALRDAQRAWITFRDQACIAEAYPWTGGSGQQMALFGCKGKLTKQRAAELWELARGY